MTDPLEGLVAATRAASEVLGLQLAALADALGVRPPVPPPLRRAGWYPGRPARPRRRDIR